MNRPSERLDELAPDPSAVRDVEAIYAKMAKRIIPFLALLFVMAWLDRVNVGFAKLQMMTDLGFSEAVYGFGAGIVYLGYALFEIPSNLLLERIGARKTFARITILWGITSIATMFVKSTTSFYVLRFLLGSFEAGLFPGVVLYLTYWFPARRRARMLAVFMIATPVSVILGGPISGWIMSSMAGRAGLANWQWLFLFEGVPSIIVGLLTLAVLVDKPTEAGWLTQRDKQLVTADLKIDHCQAGPREHGFVQALKLPCVWLLTLIYFCVVGGVTTIGLWIPSIIRGLGVAHNDVIGLLSAVPYIVAVIGMVLVSGHSDRMLERRYHSALPYFVGAVGLIAIGAFENYPAIAFAALVLAVAAPISGNTAFWQMPPMLLAGTAAAGGIALINSVGNLSGWVNSVVIGWLKDITGKTTTGLYVVATLEVLGAILILVFMPRRSVITSGTTPK
jgi:D-galactonate transporter